MEFVKRRLFLIVCGVAALAGLGLAAAGIRAMPSVQVELEQSAKLYADLGNLKPANERSITATQKRIDLIIADRDAVFEQAKKLYKYEPILAGVFPKCDSEKRRSFRVSYRTEMQKLFDSLRSGRPPGESDIESMRLKIQDEEFRAKTAGAELPAVTPANEMTATGLPSKVMIRKNAAIRAAIAAAQRIALYAVHWEAAKPPDIESSLFFEPKMLDLGTVDLPEMEDLWLAQWRYWLQRDVVEAIVALNEEAANESRERGEDRWVGTMPVKELISVRTSKGLVMPNTDVFSGAAPGGYTAAVPPAAPKMAFTQSASNEFVDVMQFSVKLIMDQRDVPKLVEKLTNNSFHTCLRIAYREVDFNKALTGKIYGSEPVVNVVMDFESNLLGDFFRRWLPEEVCKKYNIVCPSASSEGEVAPPPAAGGAAPRAVLDKKKDG